MNTSFLETSRIFVFIFVFVFVCVFVIAIVIAGGLWIVCVISFQKIWWFIRLFMWSLFLARVDIKGIIRGPKTVFFVWSKELANHGRTPNQKIPSDPPKCVALGDGPRSPGDLPTKMSLKSSLWPVVTNTKFQFQWLFIWFEYDNNFLTTWLRDQETLWWKE